MSRQTVIEALRQQQGGTLATPARTPTPSPAATAGRPGGRAAVLEAMRQQEATRHRPAPPPPQLGPTDRVVNTGAGSGISVTFTEPRNPRFEAAQSLAKQADDWVRSIAQGITLDWADEGVAIGESALGLGSVEERQALQDEREAQVGTVPAIGGRLIGGGVVGGPALAAGRTATRAQQAARSAAAGGLFGGTAAAGASEGDLGDRMEAFLLGGAVGVGTGGLLGAVLAPRTRTAAGTAAQIKAVNDRSKALYRAADQAGVLIDPRSMGKLANDMATDLANKGIDATLHPGALAVYRRFADAAAQGNPHTLSGLERLRQVALEAAKSTEARERFMANAILQKVDDFVENLQPNDFMGATGPSRRAVQQVKEARSLWRTKRKAEVLDTLTDLAATRAEQFTQSGMDNALRVEFAALNRQIIKKQNGMHRLFSAKERQAIRRVAEGTPMHRVARWLGKFSPQGPVSAGGDVLIGGGLGFALTGNPAGVVLGTLGAAGIGKSARTVAERLRQDFADETLNLALGRLPNEAGTLQRLVMQRGLPAAAAAGGGPMNAPLESMDPLQRLESQRRARP